MVIRELQLRSTMSAVGTSFSSVLNFAEGLVPSKSTVAIVDLCLAGLPNIVVGWTTSTWL